MLRTAFASMAIFALMEAGVCAQAKINCAEAHKGFLTRLDRGDFGKLSAEQLATHKRKAQRVYNACVTGDLDDPKALFDRLDANRY